MFRPTFRITPRITTALMQIEACRQAVDDLPIDATVLQHLRETAALATTHFSTFIEGNRLTLPEVKAAIKGARFPGRERDETEVRNHFRALEWMEALADRRGAVSEAAIKRLHGLVMTGRNKASPEVAPEIRTGCQAIPGLTKDGIMGKVTRKRHTPEFKAKVALEAMKGEQTLAGLGVKHGIHQAMIATWKRQAIDGLTGTFSGKPEDSKGLGNKEKEVMQLHAKIGELVVERDFLAKASGR